MQNQKDEIWKHAGRLEGKIDTALRLLKSGRRREARRVLEEAQDLANAFELLPVTSAEPAPRSITPTAGLPAGDKD